VKCFKSGVKMNWTLFSVACFSFSTLAKVSSRSSMSFFSSEHSSSSFLFLAVSSALISSSSSSLSVVSLSLASSWILLLMSPSHRSSASERFSPSYSLYNNCSKLIVYNQENVWNNQNNRIYWKLADNLCLTLCYLQMPLGVADHSSPEAAKPSSPQVPSFWPEQLSDHFASSHSFPSSEPTLFQFQHSSEEAWSWSTDASMASSSHSWMNGHCIEWWRWHLYKSNSN